MADQASVLEKLKYLIVSKQRSSTVHRHVIEEIRDRIKNFTESVGQPTPKMVSNRRSTDTLKLQARGGNDVDKSLASLIKLTPLIARIQSESSLDSEEKEKPAIQMKRRLTD